MKQKDRERLIDHFERMKRHAEDLADELDPKRDVSGVRDEEVRKVVRTLDLIGRKANECAMFLRVAS